MQFDIVGKAVRVLKLPTVNYDNHTIKVVPAQVGDVNSRFFEVHLYDDRGEIPFSQYNELYLGVTLPDDSVEYSVGEIDGDIGYVKLLSSMLQEAGRLKCSVMLRGQDDNKEEVWLTSQTFYVTVLSSSVFDESQAGNDDDYNLLLGLIKDVEDLEENIETAEAARVEAENKRVEAEKGRVSAENQRVENENERIVNENARKSAESARVTAENNRVKAEQARVSAENARDAAEDQRVENENERIENENARKSAESARDLAEDARVKAEQGRVTAEQGRVNTEKGRVSAETARVNAENEREEAEDTRQSNESARVSAENTRNANENTRKSNETARQNAETGRVNAEKNRVSAETARANAEDGREEAEDGRVSAEKGRVTAEQGRVTAEQGRVTAENNRVTEFNQKIQECEDVTEAAQAIVDEGHDLGIANSVRYDKAQDLTATQETQARTNIGAAPLASPTFTGTPKAPSPATTDDSTRIATTAYVRDVIPTIKVNNATQADKIGSADVGTSVLPVWIDNGTPKTISIKNLTAVDDAGYDVSGDRSKLITLSTLAFWNGASQGTTSNLSRAKTPATNSDTNEIATTAWVRDVVPTIASNWSFNTNSFSTSGNTVSLKMASETELGGVKAWVETEGSTTYFCVEIAD